METYPIVPQGLEQDLTSGYELFIRWDEKDCPRREIQLSPMDPNAGIRIVLRPFVEVEKTNPKYDGENEPEVVTTTIPLESLVAIDVDDLDCRQGFDTEGAEVVEDVVVPVSRWVRNPDKGLLRFTA